MNFISFGSGSSGNCYYLESGNDALLIDAGVGVRRLKRFMDNYGLSMRSVHNILLTHDHADHIKSVGSLSGTFHLPVYATESVHQGVVRNWMVKRKIEPDMVRYVEKGCSTIIGAFDVTPFNVPHDSTDNVGYVIKTEGIVFTLITDCGHITDEMGPIISNSDFLVIEANHDVEMLHNGPYPLYLQNRILGPNGHLSNESCGNAIAEFSSQRLQHVWLCHLSEKNNTPQLAFDTVADKLHTKGINAALTVLNRTTPTGIFNLHPAQ